MEWERAESTEWSKRKNRARCGVVGSIGQYLIEYGGGVTVWCRGVQRPLGGVEGCRGNYVV